MKKPFYFLSIFLVLTILVCLSSCKDDEQSIDPCATVSCDAPQTCLDGNCVCPEGFTGDNCTDELTPSKVIIKSITISSFSSEDDSGNAWDEGNGPDLVMELLFEGTVEHTSSMLQDAVAGNTYNFNTNWTIMNNLDKGWGAFLFDDDGTDGVAIMGVLNFIPYTNGEGFPEKITVENEDLKGEISLEYGF